LFIHCSLIKLINLTKTKKIKRGSESYLFYSNTKKYSAK